MRNPVNTESRSEAVRAHGGYANIAGDAAPVLPFNCMHLDAWAAVQVIQLVHCMYVTSDPRSGTPQTRITPPLEAHESSKVAWCLPTAFPLLRSSPQSALDATILSRYTNDACAHESLYRTVQQFGRQSRVAYSRRFLRYLSPDLANGRYQA